MTKTSLTALGMGSRAILYYVLMITYERYRGIMVDLERSFGFLVHDVARLFGRRFDVNGRWLGLTRAQCRTLGYLARNEGINQAGLADLLEIRPMTLVRQVDRMEESGWIERRPDPADRRARRLFLTEKARPVLDRIWEVATETQDQAFVRLSADDADRLIALLRRVHGTLSERVSPTVPKKPATVADAPSPARPLSMRRVAATVEGR